MLCGHKESLDNINTVHQSQINIISVLQTQLSSGRVFVDEPFRECRPRPVGRSVYQCRVLQGLHLDVRGCRLRCCLAPQGDGPGLSCPPTSLQGKESVTSVTSLGAVWRAPRRQRTSEPLEGMLTQTAAPTTVWSCRSGMDPGITILASSQGLSVLLVWRPHLGITWLVF